MTVKGVETGAEKGLLDEGEFDKGELTKLTKRGSKPSLTAPNVEFSCVTRLMLNCKLCAKMAKRMSRNVCVLCHRIIIFLSF